MNKLKFSPANAKLTKLQQQYDKLYSISLLSGWCCPGARDCKSKVIIKAGAKKIEDAPSCKFRCFSASQEVLYPAVYKQRRDNFRLVKRAKSTKKIKAIIQRSIPIDAKIIRLHVGGDFFSLSYLKAWIEVALSNPNIRFYAYTKSLLHLQKVADSVPSNLRIVLSRGGKYDRLIPSLKKKGFSEAKVIMNKKEAGKLKIDKDDSLACFGKKDFCLLLHGVQPQNSIASQAKQQNKKEGWTGYNIARSHI